MFVAKTVVTFIVFNKLSFSYLRGNVSNTKSPFPLLGVGVVGKYITPKPPCPYTWEGIWEEASTNQKLSTANQWEGGGGGVFMVGKIEQSPSLFS